MLMVIGVVQSLVMLYLPSLDSSWSAKPSTWSGVVFADVVDSAFDIFSTLSHMLLLLDLTAA